MLFFYNRTSDNVNQFIAMSSPNREERSSTKERSNDNTFLGGSTGLLHLEAVSVDGGSKRGEERDTDLFA